MRDSFSPEINYEEWEKMLLTERAKSDNFPDLLTQFYNLVSTFLEKNELKGRVKQHKERFINYTIPKYCKHLVHMIPYSNQDLIFKTLDQLSRLIGFYIQNVDPVTTVLFISMFSPRNRIFCDGKLDKTKLSSLQEWKNSITYFVEQNNGLLQIFNFFYSNLKAVDINAYEMLFSALFAFKDSPAVKNYNYSIFHIISTFQQWINDKYNTINAIKSTFEYVFDVALAYINGFPEQENCLDLLLQNALQNAREDSVDRNYVGLIIIHKMFDSAHSYMKKYRAAVLQTLLSKTFHEKLVCLLLPLFTIINKHGMITVSNMQSLWKKIRNTHFSVQGPYIELMSSVLATFDQKELIKLSKNMSSLFNETHDTNQEQLINKLLVKTMVMSKGYAQQVLLGDLLEKLNDEDPNSKIIVKEITNSEKKNEIIKFSPFIIQHYIINPTEQRAELVCFCLENDKVVMTREVFDAILYIAVKNENVSNAYDVVNAALDTDTVSLQTHNVQYMLTKPSEKLWNLLHKQIEEKGKSLFEDEGSIDIIFSYLDSLPSFPYNDEFILFVKDLIIILGIRNKSIAAEGSFRIIPSEFKIVNFNACPLIDVLLKMYENNPELVYKYLISLLTSTNSKQIPFVCNKIIKNIVNENKRRHLDKYVELLVKYVSKYETKYSPLVEGYTRHSNSLIPFEKRKFVLINEQTSNKFLTVIYDANDSITTQKLLNMIGSYYNLDVTNGRLLHEGSQLPLNRPIDDYSNDNSFLTLSGSREKQEHKYSLIPSVYIYNSGFLTTIMNILKREDLNENAKESIKKLLQVLPSKAEIISNILHCIDKYIDDINMENNPIIVRYMIECFVFYSFNSEYMYKFENENGVEELIKKAGMSEYSSSIGPLCTILLNATPAKLNERANELLFLIFGNFNSLDSISKSEALSLVTKLDKKSCASFVSDHIDAAKFIICNESEQLNKVFTDFLLSLNIQDKMIEMCSTEIQNKENADKFMPIFARSIPKATCDVSQYIDTCFDIAEDGNYSESIGIAISHMLPLSVKSQKDKFPTYIQKIFTMAISGDMERSRTLLNTIRSMEPNEVLNSLTNRFIKEMSMRKAPSFCYNPSEDHRSKYGVGIKNLGCICYMISVIQQISHLYPFLDRFLRCRDLSEPLEILRYILSELHLTNQQYIGIKKFCDNWTDYGGESVNINEQKDAMEFWNLLVERFPASVAALFTGKYKNTTSCQEDGSETVRYEEFNNIPVNVINCSTLEESLQELSEPEPIEMQSQSLGKMVEMSKQMAIEEAPPILVIQLKRFDYSFNNGLVQTKINTPLKISESIDIRNLMADEECSSMKYTLNGAVIHCGTVESGHYYSIIRESKGERDCWIKYNDETVSEIERDKFIEEATGSVTSSDNLANKTSAYLLFYTRNDSDKDIQPKPKIQVDKIVGPEITDSIMENNIEYNKDQCAFSKAMINFAIKFGDPENFTKYFLQIFCFSTYESFIPEIELKFNRIVSTKEGLKGALKCLIDNFEIVVRILVNCQVKSFLVALKKLIKSVSVEEDAKIIVLKIIDYFRNTKQTWESIENLSSIILLYLEASEENVKMFAEDDETLTNFISTVVNIFDTYDTDFVKNIVAVDLFKSFEMIAMKSTNEDLTNLYDIGERITLEGDSAKAYNSMTGIIFANFNDIVSSIKESPKVRPHDFYSSPNVVIKNNTCIAKAIANGDEVIRNYVVKNMNFFINFIADEDKETQYTCLSIISALFPKFPSFSQPKYISAPEYGEDCVKLGKGLIKVANAASNPDVNYNNLICAINWLIVCSGDVFYGLKEFIKFGFFLAANKLDYYDLLPAISVLGNIQLDKDIINSFFIEKPYKKTKNNEMEMFMQLVTIIFFNGFLPCEKSRIIRRPFFISKITMIQQATNKKCFKYIRDFIGSMVELCNGGCNVKAIIETIVFATEDNPCTLHLAESYVYLPEISNICERNTVQNTLKETFKFMMEQKGVVNDPSIAALCKLFMPPVEPDFFTEAEIEDLFVESNSKGESVKLNFANLIASIIKENQENTEFCDKINEIINKNERISIIILNHLMNGEEEKAFEMLCTEKIDVEKELRYSVVSNNLSSIDKSKCTDIAKKFLKYSKYETNQRSSVWSFIIDNISPNECSEVIKSLVSSFNDTTNISIPGRIESLLKIKNKFQVPADEINTQTQSLDEATLNKLKSNLFFKTLVQN